MGLQAVLNTQTDFTGEFPVEYAKDGLWRFNENAPDADTMLSDSSGRDRKMFVSGWSGTSAGFRNGQKGRHFRMNITNPASEKTYLKAANDGSIFQSLGERIIVGGWMNPTTYSVGNTYTPIFNTRQGPGQPIFYLSLIRGKPRIMLYNSSGSLILDESVTPPFSFVNNGWYFIACVIEPDNKKAQYVIGDRGSGAVWISAALSFTGELNRSCTADLIMGMHANSYWYAGGIDDWFLDCDSQLTAEDLADYFRATIFANGGDTAGEVDALAEPGYVTLRKTNGAYSESGVLYTRAVEYGLSGAGKVSVSSECIPGVTDIPLVETSTSNDLISWSDWAAVGADGKMPSPARAYIRFRVTLTTADAARTPKLTDIQIYDIPKSPYEKIGYARPVAEGISLSVGTHAITVSVDVKGVQFYGFRVCSAFSEWPSAGSATYTLAPRKFKDVDGNMAQPDRGFKLTLEMLRRKPDSALIWYEDFRDENPLPESYWTTLSGKWQVWREGYENRPYSQLEGSGQLAWKYSGFQELHLRARLAFPANGSGKAGVFCGDVFCCLNYDTQRVELYKGSALLGSYSQTISRTPNADLRGNPTMYTIEMRIRGNRVRVYSGASYTLRFTATISGFSGGYAGYRSDNRTVCELMRLGDAWTYEPYERFDVRMPDGSFKSFGRISRSSAAWDEEFQVFTLTADVEESSTRSEDISMDYDFFHSELMEISCGNNYTAEVTPRDINIWISRLFLGDADGFSILYYQDVDSLVYWANQAAYRWKLRGMCMWSLGQEDMRLWEWLPKQI